MSTSCRIPSNPDISGIGVRVAIYLQNLLCLGPAFWALSDGYVSIYELERAETQATTNLVLAFAILISCMVQARTLGLTNYHASIALSMSWMNNTNAFIYFLLYVRYKSQPRGGRGSVEPRWSAWVAHIWARMKGVLLLELGTERFSAARDAEHSSGESETEQDVSNIHGQAGHRVVRNPTGPARILFRRIALLLGSLHLTSMAALGIWLWSDPTSFGSAASSSCATEYAYLVILGCPVKLGASQLRLVSLVVYALVLIPGLNLLPPMAAFLAAYFWHHKMSVEGRALWGSALIPVRSPALTIRAGLAFLLAVDIIFIVDIELTLRKNKHLQDGEDEAQWQFGQILAMLLLSIPLRDFMETVLARREKRHLRQMKKRDEKIRKHEVNIELKRAIYRKSFDDIIRLVECEGADPDVVTEGEVRLHFTAHMAQAQSSSTANLDGQTALEVATFAGLWSIVYALIKAKANPNTIFTAGRYPSQNRVATVLQAAVRDTPGEAVQFLVENGADPNLTGDNECGTALLTACQLGDGAVLKAKYLLSVGADPNARGGEYGTPLIAACHFRNPGLVELLLDHGADPNGEGNALEAYESALQTACRHKSVAIVKVLLHRGADPNPTIAKRNADVALRSGTVLTPTQDDETEADRIIDEMLCMARGREVEALKLQIQQGMADRRTKLPDTEAGNRRRRALDELDRMLRDSDIEVDGGKRRQTMINLQERLNGMDAPTIQRDRMQRMVLRTWKRSKPS